MYRYCDCCDKHVENCGALKRPLYLPHKLYFCKKCNAKTLNGKTLTNRKRCWKCDKNFSPNERNMKGLCIDCFKKRALRNANYKRKHTSSYFDRQAKNIFKDRKSGMTRVKIAEKYGISVQTVLKICRKYKKVVET